jgi:hypothetical protein
MPDGTAVEFPDDMPKDQIKGLIANKYPDQINLPRTKGNLLQEFNRYSSMMQGKVIEGALAPVTLVGDALNWGVNKATGANLGSVSTTVRDLINAPQPETSGERIAGDVISAVSGAGGVVTAGKALTSVAPKVAQFLSAAPKQQVAAAIGGSTAAGVSRETGGSDLEQLVVGLGVGLSAGALTSSKIAAQSADNVRKQAGQLYKIAEKQGGVLKPEFADKFVDAIQGLKPQSNVAKQFAGDSEFTKAVDRLSGIKGQRITLDAANELDKLFTQEISKPAFTNSIGKLTEEGKKLFEIQSTFRNMINSADETLIEGGKTGFESLKQARALWSKSRKLADIEAIIERSALTDNPATSIKSGFRTLASNPRRLKGYTIEEVKAIRKAAETGVVTDALRTVGSRLGAVISLGSGGGIAQTASTMAGGTASRGAASAMQLKRAEAVSELIATGKKPAKYQGLAGALLGTQQGE